MRGDTGIMRTDDFPRKIDEPFLGFDIENDGDRLTCGSVYSDTFSFQFDTKAEFWDAISHRCFRGKKLFATNLEYDLGILVDKRDEDRSIKMLWRGGRLISARLKVDSGNCVNFSDTMNFTPFGVARLGQLIGIDKMARPNFSPQTPAEWDYLREYNLNDSKITYSFMKYLQRGLASIGADMKLTASSTSLNAWRDGYYKKELVPSQHIRTEQDSYSGGRCEVFIRGPVRDVRVYDFNSMYPAVMLDNEFPIASTARKGYDPHLEHEGISMCRVLAPDDMHIPLLPYRRTEGASKLLFPAGSFKGWFCHPELRKARELGYKVDVFKSILYKTEPMFKEYIKDLYSLRLKYKKDGNEIMQLVCKLLLNSLYGKFATKLEVFNAVHKSKVSHAELVLFLESGHRLAGDFLHYTSDMQFTPRYIMPIVSSYVTSYSRLKLYSAFQAAGEHNVIYSDTDSVMTTKKLPESSKLGDLKQEFRGDMVAVRPKVYFLSNDKGFKVKVKGLGHVIKGWDEFNDHILKQKTIHYKRFSKIKESRRLGLAYCEHIDCHKTLSREDDKRVWPGPFSTDEAQTSRPIII